MQVAVVHGVEADVSWKMAPMAQCAASVTILPTLPSYLLRGTFRQRWVNQNHIAPNICVKSLTLVVENLVLTVPPWPPFQMLSSFRKTEFYRLNNNLHVGFDVPYIVYPKSSKLCFYWSLFIALKMRVRMRACLLKVQGGCAFIGVACVVVVGV